ncbi:CKLF-like MARVEL transmembrane domain-containing protein 6 [Mustelus asterias]
MPHPQEHGNGGAMESERDGVYQSTTEPIHNRGSCLQLGYLKTLRGKLKLLQVILSFVAFILEEVVNSCMNCHALYFFEFVSCSAFLLTTFLLIILITSLKMKLDRINWGTVDFTYTAVISSFFLIASIIFATQNDGSSLERASVTFGFLATIAFIVDVAVHCREEGLPCKKKQEKIAEPNKGTETVKAETEPLNDPETLPV